MRGYVRKNRLAPSRGLRVQMALLVVAFVEFLALSGYFYSTYGYIPYRGRYGPVPSQQPTNYPC
jgi:hypothetical protein